MLGYKVGILLPTTYLGLPLGAIYKLVRVWDVVKEIFQRSLALQKRQYLSKGRRLTLIKSTLSILSIYFMSLFVIPRRVSLRLKQIQRSFLWGEGRLQNKTPFGQQIHDSIGQKEWKSCHQECSHSKQDSPQLEICLRKRIPLETCHSWKIQS